MYLYKGQWYDYDHTFSKRPVNDPDQKTPVSMFPSSFIIMESPFPVLNKDGWPDKYVDRSGKFHPYGGFDSKQPLHKQAFNVPPTYLECLSVRKSVYCDERGLAYETIADDVDRISYHLLVRDNFYKKAVVKDKSPEDPISGISRMMKDFHIEDRHTVDHIDEHHIEDTETYIPIPRDPRNPQSPYSLTHNPTGTALPIGSLRMTIVHDKVEPKQLATGPNMQGHRYSAKFRRENGCIRDGPEPYLVLSEAVVRPQYHHDEEAGPQNPLPMLVAHAVRELVDRTADFFPPLAMDRVLQLEGHGDKLASRRMRWEGLCFAHIEKQDEGEWERMGWKRDWSLGEWQGVRAVMVGMTKRFVVREPAVRGGAVWPAFGR